MTSALQSRLADSLARAQEAEDSLAVLHVALGRPVSGTPSWVGGEATTLMVGALRALVRITDSVICTDTQEAWMLLPGCDFDGAAAAADRAAAALADLDPAVGIAIYPDHAAQPAWLARHAEVASTRARNSGSAFAFADPQEADPPGAAIIHELSQAVRERRLVQHYQPQVELGTRQVVSAEALVRWDHPERGILEPAAFLPMAQVTRLGLEIDLEMLRLAARQVAAWAALGRRVAISVKLCGRTLRWPALASTLRGAIEREGADPALLTIELPEEALSLDPAAAAMLGELHSVGVRLCVENFGAGPASLATVERLPVDELKLDPALVHFARDPKQVGLLASLVAGGHALGLRVSATHLDSEPLVRAMWGLGCDLGQGFALGRPAPAADLGDLVAAAVPATTAASGRPARGRAAAAAPILRLPSLPRPRLPASASGTLMRLGSAAALVAAGMLAGSMPLGGSTLGATIAGYLTAPANAVLGSHAAPAVPGTTTAGAKAHQGATAGSSGGSATAGSTGTGTSGTGTSTGSTATSGSSGTGSSSTLGVPLPTTPLPTTPLPTPALPLPTPSALLP